MTDSSSPTRPLAVVTGGSGGLGRAICTRLAADGYDVALTYRANASAAEQVLTEIAGLGGTGWARSVDLTSADAVREWATELVAEHGAPAVLVHAAGPHIPMIHLSRVSPEQFQAALHAEVDGFFAVVHSLLPALRESHASVVAVTTAGTSRYPSRDGLSAAPKAAVETLCRGFAVEEGRFGVRFNCVGPGMMTDGMAERLMANGDLDEHALQVARGNIALRRFGGAGDIAAAVAFLASPAAGYITGQKLDVDGGFGL